MKRNVQRLVTVSAAAALSLAMAVPGSAAYQPGQKFQDVGRSASYYEDVMAANQYGLMAGVSGKTFDTESTITRAMWVTMLYKMAGQPAVQSRDTFTDVKTGDWFAQAATWAVEQGITAGYEDGSFGVNQTITRQEMAVMASKFAAQYKDAAVSASANLTGYADAGELDSWASEAMSWALSSGVMQAVDGKLSPKSTVSRANTAGVAVRLYELGGVDADTITSVEIDYTQAAQLPLTGWFVRNFDVNGESRSASVYISEEASTRTYITVVAVPNGVDTQQFLEDEGWIDLVDQKGEALFVLEPGADGWGSAEEEADYMAAAVTFLKSGVNAAGVGIFSTFGEFYLVGYGEGAAPLEAWAAENPIFVISQVFLDGQGIGQTALNELGAGKYDGTNGGGYAAISNFSETLNKTGMEQIARKDVPVPTWFVNYGADDSSIDYWKSANDCVASAVDGTYYQDIDSDAYQTQYANEQVKLEDPNAKYGISQVKVTQADPSAAEIYAFLSTYTRYDNTFAYSNALAYRLDYTAARVAAQKQAKAGTVLTTLQGEDGPVALLSQSDVKISGHGTVQFGVFAFSDNSGDGLDDPREYMVYIPEGFKGEKLPVLYVYPGNTQSDSIFFDCTQWYQLADREGIVLVLVCETYSAPTALTHVDAELYQTAMMAVLENEIDGEYADLDFTRVYGTGQSLGSMTTQGFARTNPEFFAAVASTSGFRMGGEDADQAIPSFLITGQSDLGDEGVNLLPNLFECENLKDWAEYLFQVNGLDATVEDYDDNQLIDSRYDVYSWKNADGISVVQWGQTLMRTHNCYPGEMPVLWDFLEHFSFEKAADGTITRYYSASAFERDDAVVLK